MSEGYYGIGEIEEKKVIIEFGAIGNSQPKTHWENALREVSKLQRHVVIHEAVQHTSD